MGHLAQSLFYRVKTSKFLLLALLTLLTLLAVMGTVIAEGATGSSI